MATISKIILPNNTQYNLQDKISGYTTNTGTVTSVTAGTGLKIGTATSGGSITTTGTINHINSITAGTAGTSSATSGNTLAVPYITYDAQGHITATGTHTHTVTGFATITNLVNGSATGSVRGTSTTSESDTYTIGRYAFAEGNSTAASGLNSHAEGSQTTASGDGSHAEGSSTIASSDSSHAEGNHTTASGMHSHAEGFFTTASGDNSHAEGFYTTASNSYCSAEGYYATASGFCSHVEGYRTTASGYYSHANGYYTVAQREAQTVIGKYNILDTKGSNGHKLGDYAFIIGNGTADDARSNALAVDWNGNIRISGNLQDMSGNSLIPSIPSNLLTNLVNGSATGSVRGINTLSNSSYTMGTNAISIGNNTKASGNYSFVEGYVDSYTKTVPGETVEVAATVSSVIEGYTDTGYLTITFTDPQYSINDLSIGDIIRRETNPQQQIPIEEIDLTNNRIKLPDGSGFSWARDVAVIVTITLEPTTLTLDYGAYGIASHAEGFNTLASGDYSHASNEGTIAASNSQTVIGKYNIADEDDDYIFIIGNGTNSDTRSNALRVDWNGNLQIAGDLQDMDGNSLLSGGGGGSSTGTEVHYVNVRKGYAPSSQEYTEFQFKERNGTLSSNVSNVAVFGVTADTNGDYRTYIRGYYPIANNSDSANITIYTKANGNNWIDLESWVNVLGGHLDICSPNSGVLGFRYGGAASATATITNTGGSELATNGNFSVGGNISTNGKTSSTQAKAGAYITTSGNIHLTGDTSTGAKINFYFGKSTSVTTSIQETSSGSLNISGNVIVGASADTVSREVTARNSLGNVGLTVGTDGSHGLYSGTKGGFLLYATKDANGTNSTLYVPRPLRVTGDITLTRQINFTATTDLGIIQGYNGTTKYNILRNHANGNVSLSACSAGLYLGYEQTTFVNFLNGLMMLNSSGDLTVYGKVISGATDTSEQYFRAINANGSIELNASAGNKGIYDRSGGRWIIYLDTNSTADTAVCIPRGLNIGTPDINGYIELYHATPYIDFHFGRSTADYTTRLWESSSGSLACTGYFSAKLYNGSSATMVGSNGTSGNRVALFATPGSTTFQIGAQWGGSTYTTKSVTVSSSDIRLKENIKDTEVEALPIINQIKVREFNWKDGKHQKIGVVADELEEIDEYLAVGGGYDEDGCMNIKSVDTFYLTGYLTKGIQELSKENEELKKQISILDAKISYLLDKTK